MAEIVLVNPRFEVSYWGLEHALPLLGKRANLPVACLPLLAALTPAEHRVTLVDENVEPIDFELLAQADIVGVTGMSVQRARMHEILGELKQRGVFTVVGGPWATVQEDDFTHLADVTFVGEAEATWPRFLEDWQAGQHAARYEQRERTDMTEVPAPRLDLLRTEHYMFGSLQLSRGCPFQCEFCDIIVTFGRRPRIKSAPQVLVELDALLAHRLSVAFIVDDNLIGNKQAIKPVLRAIIDWQTEHGYPLTFFTEASLDLAEDAELLELMGRANIQSVFIGIESPSEASLRETKKYQNVRGRAGTLLERVARIQQAGIEVWCGMILGFDHDEPSIFARQCEFLAAAQIVHAMVGMLHAIPKTPLYARLEAAGRLDLNEPRQYGTNIVPLGMSRDELVKGYLHVMQQLYAPENYFARLESLYLTARFWPRGLNFTGKRRHRLRHLTERAFDLVKAGVIFYRLMRHVPDVQLRREYRRRMLRYLRVVQHPRMLFVYVLKCAMHYHHYTMAQQMTRRERPVVNTF